MCEQDASVLCQVLHVTVDRLLIYFTLPIVVMWFWLVFFDL